MGFLIENLPLRFFIVSLFLILIVTPTTFAICSNGQCKLGDDCLSSEDCEAGLHCFSCEVEFRRARCVRSYATNQFALVNSSLPFNKYAYLATHNSFAIDGEHSHTGKPRLTFANQEDNITQQLINGVRVLMLDTYDYKGEIWLCHSFQGKCHAVTAYEPAIETLKEVETFLSQNPSEIVTIILEDYVETPNGLTKVFNESGLMKYWFPVLNMPQNGEDWPLVKDMVSQDHRLIVFTSNKDKEESEGIAYQWSYMVENKYGKDGMHGGECENRAESSALNDKTKSLVFVNHFRSIPVKQISCLDNSADLIAMLDTCYTAAGNRWPNFVAVDFYERSDKGGAFQAVDRMNGKLLCGSDDVHDCVACAISHLRENTIIFFLFV